MRAMRPGQPVVEFPGVGKVVERSAAVAPDLAVVIKDHGGSPESSRVSFRPGEEFPGNVCSPGVLLSLKRVGTEVTQSKLIEGVGRNQAGVTGSHLAAILESALASKSRNVGT